MATQNIGPLSLNPNRSGNWRGGGGGGGGGRGYLATPVLDNV